MKQRIFDKLVLMLAYYLTLDLIVLSGLKHEFFGIRIVDCVSKIRHNAGLESDHGLLKSFSKE